MESKIPKQQESKQTHENNAKKQIIQQTRKTMDSKPSAVYDQNMQRNMKSELLKPKQSQNQRFQKQKEQLASIDRHRIQRSEKQSGGKSEKLSKTVEKVSKSKVSQNKAEKQSKDTSVYPEQQNSSEIKCETRSQITRSKKSKKKQTLKSKVRSQKKSIKRINSPNPDGLQNQEKSKKIEKSFKKSKKSVSNDKTQ